MIEFLKILFSRTTWPIWTKLGTKHSWVKGIQFCSKEGPHAFSRGDNNEIDGQNFYSRTFRPISTKLGTKNLWVNEIQVCSNEGPGPFQGEMIAKCIIEIFKKIFSRTTELISTKLGEMYLCVKGIQIFEIVNHSILKKECVYWLELLFRWRWGPWTSCYLFIMNKLKSLSLIHLVKIRLFKFLGNQFLVKMYKF